MATRFDYHRRNADRVADDVGDDAVDDATDAVYRTAVGDAPVLFGDYRAGLRREVSRDGQGPIGRVIGGHWSSGIIAVGSPTSPAFGTLRNAVEANGLDLR